VFSRPEVIRRVNSVFVPVALKAGLVNNPGDDEEGRLYREIGRSKPAPQGICVANSDGKVIAWTLMFDDNESILAFLDHTLERFGKYPDARQPFAAQRYMKFPSSKLPDVPDSGGLPAIPDQHTQNCPANPRPPSGTVVARLFGRALDENGQLISDTTRQEHYVEDRFNLPVEAQSLLARAGSNAGTNAFRMPGALARQLISHAFLGQLDVNPLGSPAGGTGDLKEIELWVQNVSNDQHAPVRLRVAGASHVAGGEGQDRPARGGDGRIWEHEIKLDWDGFIEMQGRPHHTPGAAGAWVREAQVGQSFNVRPGLTLLVCRAGIQLISPAGFTTASSANQQLWMRPERGGNSPPGSIPDHSSARAL
jgi:hypothetical protein